MLAPAQSFYCGPWILPKSLQLKSLGANFATLGLSVHLEPRGLCNSSIQSFA
jgi:hypothetical protein